MSFMFSGSLLNFPPTPTIKLNVSKVAHIIGSRAALDSFEIMLIFFSKLYKMDYKYQKTAFISQQFKKVLAIKE